MNYRHDYHAGNFADCFKHALLVALVEALARKPAPFFVLETHAGSGEYDLSAAPARRTGEADAGIRRLLPSRAEPLAPYLKLVTALTARGDISDSPGARHPTPSVIAGEGPPSTPAGEACFTGKAPIGVRHRPDAIMAGEGPPSTPSLRQAPQAVDDRTAAAADRPGLGANGDCAEGLRLYPGSPRLIRALLRPDDRLVCCELQPEACRSLRRLFRDDPQTGVHERSGWEALGSLLPPKQKRGLVFIDPPFEQRDEFATLADGLARGHRRFGHGVFAAWYPIKQLAAVRGFLDTMRMQPIRDIVAIELYLREQLDPGRLNGCGLLVINPPYQFEEQARQLAAAVLDGLGAAEPGAHTGVIRIADE